MSIDFPKEEEVILERWREIRAFERQVRLHKYDNMLYTPLLTHADVAGAV